MTRTLLAALAAAFAMYLFGFAYWAGNPLPYAAWKHTLDDEAAGRALREHFPESGTYYLPGSHHDAETRTRLHERGPVAFVHVTARDGRPVMESAMMAKGFGINLAVAFLLAVMLGKVRSALPGYGQRLAFAALGGLAAAVLVDLGDAVWWYIPLEWKLHQALYTFSVWLVGGAVLAAFIKPRSQTGGTT